MTATVIACYRCIPAGACRVQERTDGILECNGCGERAYGRNEYGVFPLVLERGSWATATGALVGPATR